MAVDLQATRTIVLRVVRRLRVDAARFFARVVFGRIGDLVRDVVLRRREGFHEDDGQVFVLDIHSHLRGGTIRAQPSPRPSGGPYIHTGELCPWTRFSLEDILVQVDGAILPAPTVLLSTRISARLKRAQEQSSRVK